jgi:hypothetical protein
VATGIADKRSEDGKRDATPVSEASAIRTSDQSVEAVTIDEPPPSRTAAPSPISPKVATRVEPPAIAPPKSTSVVEVNREKPRTLTLDPLPAESTQTTPPLSDMPVEETADEYPSLPQVADRPWRAAPQAVRVTNVADQLAVPIESIELPAMPIGEFVAMISDMAAVSITLDPAVLGDAGLSSRTTVTVRADDVTLGTLLTTVLNEHDLACDERDGQLVVVKRKGS